jgi:hypothetical protein
MELWGSSYLLQDVQPVRLVGTIGSSTERAAPGTIRVSFHQEPGVFAVMQDGVGSQLLAKWDLALRLMALVHVLVLQNRLLRGEKPELRSAERERVFSVAGGGRASPILCSWDSSTMDVECHAVGEGEPDQYELVLKEEAAAELVAALAERIATNGIAAQEGSDRR